MMKRITSIKTYAARAAVTLFLAVLTTTTAWAQDYDLGFITASAIVDGGQTSNWNSTDENYNKLVDGDTGTKYGLSNNDPYVEFHYDNAITPKGYALWTANDSEGERNPRQWTIKAKVNSSDAWTTLVTVDNTNGDKLPMANNTQTLFSLDNSTAYQYFRFEATRASNGAFQLAELQFCTVSPALFIQAATITGVNSYYFYDGSAISITPAVTDANSTALTLGTDFTATLNNENVGSFPFTVTAEGNYPLTITGMGSYSGSQTVTFRVSDCPDGLSIDNDFTKGQDGYYYVNMPGGTETNTITLPDGFTSNFKVYDNGGKSNNYSFSALRSTLVLTAPAGYMLQLSGTVTTYPGYDYLVVYDGDTELTKESSDSENTPKVITTVISSGQSMRLYFNSTQTSDGPGLDLTVRLLDNRTEHNITVNTATGGSITSDKTKAKAGETITLTVGTPTSGYMLSDVSVEYGSSMNVPINWDGMNDNTITFTMPDGDVSLTPTFTNTLTAASGLFINMPATGNASYSIPSGVTSFKVYDSGGKNGNYSDNYNGSLTLTAPTNDNVLQVSGSVTTEQWVAEDYLIVYDGASASGTELLPQMHSNKTGEAKTFNPVVSSGQSVTLYFKTDDYTNFAGLDLTVTVGSATSNNSITVNTATGGSITSIDKTSAKANETVTLTATPTEGYLLKEVIVSDGSNTYSVTDGNWHSSNTATFSMPVTAVSVTPVFTDNLTADGGLYINMPKTGNKTVSIPSGVGSFKVYDDGGENDLYSDNCNGTLTLTAPEGYVLRLSGNIKIEQDHDKLDVYNGSTTSDSKLLDGVSGSNYGEGIDITTVTSSGQSMMLSFHSDNNGVILAGLDLTVTLVPITYTVSFQKNNDNATGTMDAQTHTYDAELALTANSFEYTGYAFAGWATTADGEVVYTDKQSVSNLTTTQGANVELFAKWKKLLTNADIAITDIPSQEYSGSAIEPTVTVSDGSTNISSECDFAYSNNMNTGTATVTITAKATSTAYSGTTSTTFTITPKTVTVKNNQNEDVPAATGDATITEDENGITLTLITPTGTDAPQTVSIPTAVEVDHVTIQRTYVSGKASTVYLPFSIEVSKLSGGTFHTFTNVDQTTSPWTVNYSVALASTATLEANTPYLFLPDGTNEGKIVVNNGTDKVSVCTANPQTTTQGQWEFIGTYEPIVWAAEHADLGKVYGFAAIDKEVEGKNITAGQFVKAAAGASIAPMRAYLKYTPPSAAPARGISRGAATDELPATMRVVIAGANGETTEVGTIGIEQYSGEWYTIDGRKLSGAPTKKGLYIHNGRKNVIK